MPAEDRISGPGTSVIMAAFAHLNPGGSRFSDGSYGVFYSADGLDTAIAETRHHREWFLSATSQAPMELDMRVYLVDLEGELHNLLGQRTTQPSIYHPDDYAAGQHLGGVLHKSGSNGIVYDSLCRAGGECAAVFRPSILSNAGRRGISATSGVGSILRASMRSGNWVATGSFYPHGD